MAINPPLDSVRTVFQAHKSLKTSKKEQHAIAQIIANEVFKELHHPLSFLEKVAFTWHTMGSGAKEYETQKKANRLLTEVAVTVFGDKLFRPEDPSEKDYEAQLDELIERGSHKIKKRLEKGDVKGIKLYLTLFPKEKQQKVKNDLLLQAFNLAINEVTADEKTEAMMLNLIENGADIHYRNKEKKNLGQRIVQLFPVTSKVAQEAAKRLQAGTPSTGFTFTELPNELQQEVILCLPLKEVLELRRVSKEIKSHIDDTAFYRTLLNRHFPHYTPSDRLPLLKQIEILQKMQEHPMPKACIDALGGPVEFEKLPIIEFDDEMIKLIETNQLNLPAYHMTAPVMRGIINFKSPFDKVSESPFVAICTLNNTMPSAILFARGSKDGCSIHEDTDSRIFPSISRRSRYIYFFESQWVPHFTKLLKGKTIQNKCLLHPEFTPQEFKNTRLQGEVLLFDKKNPEEQKTALKEIEHFLQEGADLHSPYHNDYFPQSTTVTQYVSRHFPVDSEIAHLIAKYATKRITTISQERIPNNVVQEIGSHLSIEEAIQMRRISKGIKEEDGEFYKFLIQQHFPTYQLQPESKISYLRQLQILTHFKNYIHPLFLEIFLKRYADIQSFEKYKNNYYYKKYLNLPIVDLENREVSSVTLKEMEGPIVRSLTKLNEGVFFICTKNLVDGSPCLSTILSWELPYVDRCNFMDLIDGQVANGQRLMTQEEVAQLNASS